MPARAARLIGAAAFGAVRHGRPTRRHVEGHASIAPFRSGWSKQGSASDARAGHEQAVHEIVAAVQRLVAGDELELDAIRALLQPAGGDRHVTVGRRDVHRTAIDGDSQQVIGRLREVEGQRPSRVARDRRPPSGGRESDRFATPADSGKDRSGALRRDWRAPRRAPAVSPAAGAAEAARRLTSQRAVTVAAIARLIPATTVRRRRLTRDGINGRQERFLGTRTQVRLRTVASR